MADNDRNKNINYTYKPTETVLAKFDGFTARCGKCNRKLGEFVNVDGEIQCPKAGCCVKNKVKI